MSFSTHRAEDVAECLTIIETVMKAAGWTDDGAPTATILKSADDAEGRAIYIKLRETATPGGPYFELGDARSGDNVTLHGGGAPTGGGAYFDPLRWFTLIASDRWISYHLAADNAGYGWVIAGAFESPMAVGNQASVAFIAGSKNDSFANVVVRFDRYGSSGNYFCSDQTSANMRWLAPLVTFKYGATGLREYPTPSELRPMGYTEGIARFALPFWFCNYNPFVVSGYLKDALIVTNVIINDDRFMHMRVIKNGYYYYMAGSFTETSLGTEETVALFLKGDAV